MGVNAQLPSPDVQSFIPSILVDLQRVINKNSKVFGDTPKGIPPIRDHDHTIHLQSRILTT